MKKHTFLTEASKKNDVERCEATGPVKQIMETLYKAIEENGKPVAKEIITDSTVTKENFVFTFTPDARYKEQDTFGRGSRETAIYGDNNKVEKRLHYYSAGLSSTNYYIYDSKNQLIESYSNDAEGKIQYRFLHTLDEETGEEVESLTYFADHKTGELQLRSRRVTVLGSFITRINDSLYKTRLSSTEYDGEGNVTYEFTAKYDDRGNRLESKTVWHAENMKKSSKSDRNIYNEHNDSIEVWMYDWQGALTYHQASQYEYDSEGKKIEKDKRTHEERIADMYPPKPDEREEEELDHHGNWIKRTLFYKNRPVKMSLRQISYYGEESEHQPPFVHPLLTTPASEITDHGHKLEKMKPKHTKWVTEGTQAGEQFPLLRYYSAQYNEFPSVVNFTASYIATEAVLELLQKEYDAQIIHSTSSVQKGMLPEMNSYVLCFPDYDGYLLKSSQFNKQECDDFEIPTHVEDLLNMGEEINFSHFTLYRPADSSEMREEYFEEEIANHIEECMVERVAEKPYINIIETAANGGFVMVEHPVDDDFEIDDLDINYGQGFEEFHDDLMDRFNNSTKGLVLFHGQPGTGKTYYIRHLLRSMAENKKVVIYMPPNMVDYLVEPGFMTFLSTEIRDWSSQGLFCVLLIEDAEPLLTKRREGVRIQGVTNLLNLSDGLLNDMLNLQIICTFNVDLKKLDSALLRPGRLIARKEFKALEVLDANLLAQRLGIKQHITKPATLGEIYAMRKDQNILIHDVDADSHSSTYIDDLID